MSELIRVNAGQVLVVSIDAAAPVATVWLDGTDSHWVATTESPLCLGAAGLYRIESDGTYLAEVKTPDGLAKSGRDPISVTAIIKGTKMSLAEKMKRVAERTKTVTQGMEAKADAHLARLDDLEQRGAKLDTSATTLLDANEAGIKSLEDVFNQLSNGDPDTGPLPG